MKNLFFISNLFFLRWVCSTNRKDIGILYLILSDFSIFLGTMMSIVIKLELADVLERFTNTLFVQKAQENIVELLLINHPLDCPIRDQGVECDLQDQSKSHGSGHSRYFFKKLGVKQKSFTLLMKTKI
jgi:hypothetical protein